MILKKKFLTGTDEHGQKVEKAAKSQNKSPLEYANFISKDFIVYL